MTRAPGPVNALGAPLQWVATSDEQVRTEGSLGFRVAGGHGAAHQAQVAPGLVHQPGEGREASGPGPPPASTDTERLPTQRLGRWPPTLPLPFQEPSAHTCPR